MSENNFFNLNLTHRVVKDFNEDHQKSMKLYKESYNYINNLDAELQPEDEDNYEKKLDFYRTINRTCAMMKEIFINAIISYYAFRKAAGENEEIMKEFRELPADFSPVEEQYNDLINGYETVLGHMKEAL